MKERPILFSGEMVRAILKDRKTQTRRAIKTAKSYIWEHQGKRGIYTPCRYGQPGDRLWVKETWGRVCGKDLVYKADIHPGLFTDRNTTWKSPLFMPRWASRITLEITAVRVQKLQDITESDAVAEGFKGVVGETIITPYERFIETWDNLNAKRGFPWSLNPVVWAIEFRRVPPPFSPASSSTPT